MSTVSEIESLKNKLALERAKMTDAIAAWPRQELERPFLDGWSVKDLVAHVANSEALNVKFAKLMLECDEPVQVQAVAADYPDYTGPFELDRFNAYMTDKLRGRSFDVVVQTLRETRDATLAWMDTLTPEQLERKGTHAAWGEQSVRAMLKVLVLHDKMHTRDIIKGPSPRE
ncbi:MAG: DinB family protein [Chloroflexi bacterium]|nr:DinB family protein [Chloroflexota bacterium]